MKRAFAAVLIIESPDDFMPTISDLEIALEGKRISYAVPGNPASPYVLTFAKEK